MKRILFFVFCLTAIPAFGQTPAENDSSAAAAKKVNGLPLIPTRTLQFTTNEGSWISLDLSPDGKTILFELLGDLYTLPIEGGVATRITSGQAYDMQPRFSPDGEKIVFISDRNGSENVWVANADGTEPEARTSGERENYVSPVWSPDGDYIVVTKRNQLWTYHREGGSGIQMTGHGSGPQPTHIGAAFSDDPRYLWVNLRGQISTGFDTDDLGHDEYGRVRSPQSSPRRIGLYQIGQLDRENGRVLIRTHEHEGAFRPVPSPDGKWLVYATRHDSQSALKLMDLATGEEHWLVMDVQRDNSQGGGVGDRDIYPGSVFTADSKALITSYNGKIMRVEIPSGAASEIPFEAEIEQELGPLVKFDYPINDSTLIVSQIRGARPSPDGSQVVFAALDRLWIADLPQDLAPDDSTHPVITSARRLTEDNWVEHAPVWSPDGQYIAYVTWDDSLGGNIYRMGFGRRAQPERLTQVSAFYDKLAYSRDGQRLMAARGSKMHRMRTLEDFGNHGGASEMEYVWLSAEGGPVHRIAWVGSATTQQSRNVPHFGPDPDRVYVWAGNDGLLSMRFDGTDMKTHFKVRGPAIPSLRPGSTPPPPNEVVLAPDGRHAIVQANRNVYLITVPPPTGEPPTIAVGSSSVLPSWRLTKVGGDFVGWKQDGVVAHYSIGKSYFEYDLAEAAAQRQRIADWEKAEAARADSVNADSTNGDASTSADSTAANDGPPKPGAYKAQRYDIAITAAKDKPKGTIVLRNARVITMVEDEVLESGDIVIRDNRIEAVGPSGEVGIPDGAAEYDMAGKTIMPGLVDIHAHTWVAWGLHRSQVSQFLAQLAWGVTTQRDPQTSSEDVLAYSDLMETGDLIGPRLYSTGPGIFWSDNIKSLEEARDVLKRYADHFGTLTIKQYMAGDRKIRQWVIMAANELGLTPTTEGGANFTMNLTLMQDGYAGLEHSLPISPFYKDVVELTAFSGIAYTPTLVVSYGGPSGLYYYLTNTDLDGREKLRYFTPHDELDKWKQTQYYRDDQYVHFLHAEQLTKVVEAGGRVGLGSHGEVQGLGTHWELWMMAAGDMDNHDALRAATIHSADAIGLDGDIGSLEAGKLADLIVLDENPLDDIENTDTISHVMKNGRLYEGDTLTEIWPRQRALPTQWWWRVEPEEE